MNATITQTYSARDRRDNLYTMLVNDAANELRNAVCMWNAAHSYPDDGYLLNRGLMGAILDRIDCVCLNQDEVDLIVRVQTWADSIVAQYRTDNAIEISEYERDEQKSLSDIEVLSYATNS